jgi:hypothetical protein
MMGRTGFAVFASIALAILFQSPITAMSREGASIKGLWRFVSVMPAGVLSEEKPEVLNDYVFYWFLDDGTVTLLNNTAGESKQQRGMW